MNKLTALRAELEKRYSVSGIREQRPDLAFLDCSRIDVPDALAFLRDYQGYVHLSFITCVDRLEDEEFELVYMLRNHELRHDLGVRTRIDRKNPVMESTHNHWAAVSTYQRELHEMFGIDFPGSPGVEESFALEGWAGPPPMRRDFDTKKYSEETYFPRPGRETHDPAEHMKKTRYPGRADL
jgi:NADH-quinone oxidoreductase subunit C